MITDMLKISVSLPAYGIDGKESVYKNEGPEYGDDFAAVLAQVSGQEDKTAETKPFEPATDAADARQAGSSGKADSVREDQKGARVAQSKQVAGESDSPHEAVGHSADKPGNTSSTGLRLSRLAEKVKKMGAFRRVAVPEPDAKTTTSLQPRDAKHIAKDVQALKGAVSKTVHGPRLKGQVVKDAAQQSLLKVGHSGANKHAESGPVKNGEALSGKVAGSRMRTAKIKGLWSNRAASHRGEQSDVKAVTSVLNRESQSSLSRELKTESSGPHESVLSKYEGSVKTVDVKPQQNAVQIADGSFDEIVRQFTILMRRGGGEAKLLLQPEHLGSLKLRIQVDRGEVATSILVDNQAVKDLILSRLNILEESLLEHGFDLSSFDVGVKGENSNPETASGMAGGRQADGSSGESLMSEEEVVEGPESAGLPWMSTRVNITV
jgi:flagellar hook-length control protein FliK